MNKIRAAIIHWLGGVTEEEAAFERHRCYISGFQGMTNAAIWLMESCNGLPAEEWCKRVWDGINELKRANK